MATRLSLGQLENSNNYRLSERGEKVPFKVRIRLEFSRSHHLKETGGIAKIVTFVVWAALMVS
jgi:hypothetical protein